MNDSTSKPSTYLPLETTNKVGFFEKVLTRQLQRLSKGKLSIQTPSNTYRFGVAHPEDLTANIWVNNPEFFKKSTIGGSLGVADSYADGDWETDDLVKVFRIFLQNQDVMDGMEKGWATALNKVAMWSYQLSQKNTIKGSRKNISLHYDLGNEFYQMMLDPTMTYSCGIFQSSKSTLEEASLAKYDRIIDELDIQPHHHVLEIGCGWGGFASRLAERTQAKLTATTISQKQFQYALKRMENEKVGRKVAIIRDDYRNLEGKFDRIVSIEMIEAVGHEYLPTYFSKISNLLKPDGAALIQGITMPDHRYARYLKKVDYIRTRVFPGSCVPSASAMIEAATSKSDLRPLDLQDIGFHYTQTLFEWRKRFLENREDIKSLGYDESFLRAWEYYLCYCEAGFAEGYTSNVHLLLGKPQSKLKRESVF
jgi:cyclopropane-fatty-acyl-phospholipid synthase